MNRGTHLALGDTGRAENRVVRILNLHYQADDNDIHKFFGDEFTIVDFIRGVNPKTNKNTVGYVLFATEQERIDAQALSNRHILGREVIILPAQGGFQISSLGDKFVAYSKSRGTATFDGDQTCEVAPPTVGDHEAFPSLGVAATPGLEARRYIRGTQPAQQRASQNRLLFMNNVGKGSEVDKMSFQEFFGEYTLVDVKRPIDPRTNSPHPTAFAMLASTEQRDGALNRLRNALMHDRKVTLEVPKTYHNVDKFGFVLSPGKNIVTFATPQDDVINTNTPRTSPPSDLSFRKDLQLPSPTSLDKAPIIESSDAGNNNEFRVLLGQLARADNEEQQQAPLDTRLQRQQDLEVARQVQDKRQINKTVQKWGLSREKLITWYIAKQRTLLPTPPSVGGQGQSQIITYPPMTLPAGSSLPFIPPLNSRLCKSPSGIDTSFCPREYSWSLSGNQGSTRDIVSEEAWYSGQWVLRQREYKYNRTEPTKTQHIMTGNGIIKDSENN